MAALGPPSEQPFWNDVRIENEIEDHPDWTDAQIAEALWLTEEQVAEARKYISSSAD